MRRKTKRMSIARDLKEAESILATIEAYVQTGRWHPGKNLEAILGLNSVNEILRKVEGAPLSIFAEIYLDQMEKISGLSQRSIAAKERLPENPWSIFKVNSPIEST